MKAQSFDRVPFENLAEGIAIYNRILVKVDGRPISVMDIVKKMDLLFYRQYPDLTDSNIARYQFYSTGWKAVLNAMVDELLIVADAEEKKIEVADGDVREELEKSFGPDVVFNLDKIGVTLDEAFQLLKSELLVQKMMNIMVRAKAITEINPTKVRQRYEEWVSKNPPFEEWIYQVISIRGSEHKEVAEKAYALLKEQNLPLDVIAQTLKSEETEITLSEEYHRKESELSLSHKALLNTMAAGSFQLSDQKELSRIFYLKNREKKEPSSFHEMEDKCKKQLIDEAVQRHNIAYRERLRNHYGLTEKYLKDLIPDSFEPFALK